MRLARLALIALAAVACAPARPAPPPAPIGSTATAPSVEDPVTAEDVEIVERALRRLDPAAQWDRTDDRQCPDPAVPLSLYCALYHLSVRVLGGYDHRRPALEEVRAVIQEHNPSYEHRLMDFNNDPATTYVDVRRVLAVAAERLRARVRAKRPAAELRDEEALIAAVLEHSFGAPDALADARLLPATGPIYVVIEVRRPAGAEVTQDALPIRRNPRLVLARSRALQEEAERRSTSVWFVTIKSIEIDGDRASVGVGVDEVLPSVNLGTMCCCTSQETYERRDGRWQYLASHGAICM